MRSGLLSRRRWLSSDSSARCCVVIIDQRAAVARAALGIAECVEFERHPVSDAERLQDAVPERDDLDIGLRLRDAQQLDADLMKLAKAALLRPLIAEHRAANRRI